MAFVSVNGFDVEHASSMLVYENLVPELQHINGKGCTDKFTKTDDVSRVTYIDVMRVLPLPIRFRQYGSSNNGTNHNQNNEGGFNNAPQSVHYTIPVDLYYDEGVPISSVQDATNPITLEAIVNMQIVKTAGWAINVITFAKQIEGHFRNGDNYDKAKTHVKGEIIGGDIKAGEVDEAVAFYDPAKTGLDPASPTFAFQKVNAILTDGIPELGAFKVPMENRQAFITTALNISMKGQYAQNASEASARILANGYINPFTDSVDTRIGTGTGLCGMYDGVDMYLVDKMTRQWVYVALGILGTGDDSAGNLPTVRGLLDKITGMIVYGAGTCRGVVGPTVTANPNTYFGGVYILPQMKVGVEVLNGSSIKLIVDAGKALAGKWTADNIAMIMNTIVFTAIDGKKVKGAFAGFNDGTTN